MKIYDCLRLSLKSFIKKKKRNLLTVIGIAVGIMTVVFINISSSSGIAAISSEMSKMGVNCSVVKCDYYTAEKISDVQKLLGNDFYISTVIKTEGHISSGKERAEVTVYGCDEQLTGILNYELLYGRNISVKDLINSEKNIIIDSVTANKLFSEENALGKKASLELNGISSDFTVVGITDSSVLCKNEATGIPSGVFIPHTLLNEKNAISGKSLFISGKTGNNDEDIISVALNQINSASGNYSPMKTEPTNIYKENIGYISETMRLILMLIAFVSVISGCVNMINIMFMDINERRKEIALKKALGQTNAKIIVQIVGEGVIIMLIAALSGIILGSLLSFYALDSYGIVYISDFKFQLSLVGASVFAGILFGLLPLKRIFKMNPVDIL